MPSTRSGAGAEPEALTRTLMTVHTLYETYIVPQLPIPLQHISDQVSTVLYQAYPYLSQAVSLVTSLATTSSSDSSLLSLGILLITLYMGLRIANYIRRTIFGWVWLGVKLVLFLLLVQVVIYVNSYGVDKALKDAGWAGGLVWGFLEDALEGNGYNMGAGQATRRTTPRGMRSRNDERNYRRQQQQAGGRNRWS